MGYIKDLHKTTLIVIFLMAIILIRIWFVLHNDRNFLIEKYTGRDVQIFGSISDEPQMKDFLQTFTIKTEKINDDLIETYIKVQTNRYTELEYNQKLKLDGKLSPPFNFKSNGGRVFDYVNYLLKDGIFFVIKKPDIEIISDSTHNSISQNLFSMKRKFLNNLKRVLGEPHAALAGGLVVGEKGALGKDLLDDFRKSGLIHIVVLSGYNITIVAESIKRILAFLPRVVGIGLGGVGILAFGILVGGGATVVRSCIMAVIALLATLLRKDYNATRALFIAALLMLIQNPLILFYDPSFQLSFLATLGLIVLSSPIEERLGFITEKFGIRGLIASTFATQIFVSPYILYMMGQLSVVGIIVNILVLPIIPMTMLLVFMTGIFGFISHFASQTIAWISHIFLSYEIFMVRFFAHLPFAYIELPRFSFRIVMAFYLSYFIAFTKFSSIFFQFKFKKKSST